MSAVSIAPAVSAGTVPSSRTGRTAGFAGLAFAVIVGAVNVTVGSLAPPAMDAGATEITDFVTSNSTALRALSGAVPFAVFALFIFLASVYPRISAASPEAALWSRVGAIGIVLVEVMFLTRMIFELVLIANVEKIASETVLVETLWQFQNAAMILNGLALAVTLVGLSRAARLSALIPAWQEALGYTGALGFFIGAVAAVTSLEGAAIGIIGLPAFLTWLVWLAMTSIRLLRAPEAA